jgi:prophage DNA circulation protein
MGGKNPMKSWVTAPIDAVKSLGKGDLMGVIDAAGRVVSAGTLSANDISGRTAAEEAKKATAAASAQQTEAINNLAKAQTTAATDANAKRRAATAEMTKTIYTTALGAVNETAESAPLKKKTLLGG